MIPGGMTYVPGTLELLTGPGAPASPTDAAGDDVAELDAANNRIVFRLGTGADATQGGLIAAAGTAGDSASFSFDVIVNEDNANGAEIVNRARATFFGQTLGIPLTADTTAVTTTVAAPDLTIAKTHTGPLVGGATTQFTLVVSNEGAAATDGTTVTASDTFPPSTFASLTVTSAPGWSCTVVATEVTCTREDVLPAEDTYPPIQLSALLVPAPPAQIENTASVGGGGDSVPTNNSSTDVGPGVVEADLQLTKTAEPETALTGEQVTFTLVVRNGGPSAATGVVIDDPLGPAFSAQSAVSTQGTCDTTVSCAIGTLAPDAEATVTIIATVAGPARPTTTPRPSPVARPTRRRETTARRLPSRSPNTADLVLTKTGSPETPDAGVPDGLTYTLAIQNAGPATATDVRLTRSAPGPVHALERRRRRLHLQPASRGRHTRLHEAVPDRRRGPGGDHRCRHDGASGRRRGGQETQRVSRPPRAIHRPTTTPRPQQPRHSGGRSRCLQDRRPGQAPTGQLVAYTLTVRNQGPSEATNVELTDTLEGPARTIVSVAPSQGTCTARSRSSARSAAWPRAPRRPSLSWCVRGGRDR